jgi:hypothetical protein
MLLPLPDLPLWQKSVGHFACGLALDLVKGCGLGGLVSVRTHGDASHRGRRYGGKGLFVRVKRF